MADKYIAIPIEVEALQFNIANLSELVIFTKCSNFQLSQKGDVYNCLITVDGLKLLVIEGNYVVKDSGGNIKIMTAEIFEKSYIKKE